MRSANIHEGPHEPVGYLSPKAGCTEAVADALSRARSTVLVQAYSFTSAPIAKALVHAHRRGVKIQVILDKSNQTDKYSAATFLKNYGLPTYIDDRHAIAHNKIMIIDDHIVLTGSFNFTKQAEEHNAETCWSLTTQHWLPSTPRTGMFISCTASLTNGRNQRDTDGECSRS